MKTLLKKEKKREKEKDILRKDIDYLEKIIHDSMRVLLDPNNLFPTDLDGYDYITIGHLEFDPNLPDYQEILSSIPTYPDENESNRLVNHILGELTRAGKSENLLTRLGLMSRAGLELSILKWCLFENTEFENNELNH